MTGAGVHATTAPVLFCVGGAAKPSGRVDQGELPNEPLITIPVTRHRLPVADTDVLPLIDRLSA